MIWSIACCSKTIIVATTDEEKVESEKTECAR